MWKKRKRKKTLLLHYSCIECRGNLCDVSFNQKFKFFKGTTSRYIVVDQLKRRKLHSKKIQIKFIQFSLRMHFLVPLLQDANLCFSIMFFSSALLSRSKTGNSIDLFLNAIMYGLNSMVWHNVVPIAPKQSFQILFITFTFTLSQNIFLNVIYRKEGLLLLYLHILLITLFRR